MPYLCSSCRAIPSLISFWRSFSLRTLSAASYISSWILHFWRTNLSQSSTGRLKTSISFIGTLLRCFKNLSPYSKLKECWWKFSTYCLSIFSLSTWQLQEFSITLRSMSYSKVMVFTIPNTGKSTLKLSKLCCIMSR